MRDKYKCRFFKKDYCKYYCEDCNPNTADCIKAYSSKEDFLELSFGSCDSKKNDARTFSVLPEQAYLDSLPHYRIKGEMIDLHVYGGNLHTQYHDCLISILDFHRTVRHDIFVSRAETGKYYIANEVLKVYINRGYTFYAKLKYASYSECSDPIVRGTLAVASPLKLYGYAVGKNGQSAAKRHSILNFIISHSIMSISDIINLLQFNIVNGEASSANKEKAIAEWKQDIRWIADTYS